MKAINTEEEYNQALKRLEEIFDAKWGTPEGDELDELGTLINSYEAEHLSIELPKPNDAIKFRMEQMGM